MGLENDLPGQRLYLDANVFIYALEGYPAFVELLGELFDAIDRGQVYAVTSELVLAECLAKPMMDNNAALRRTYEQAFEQAGSLYVAPVSRDILVGAAALRAKNAALKLPDAIHAATALANACETFVTNDIRLKAVPSMYVAVLSEIVATG